MGQETYAEISEKKTSKLGYLILIALFFFLIIMGQTVFHDISTIPERPIYPTFCANSYSGRLEYIRNKPRCTFNEIDKKYELDTLISDLEPDVNKIIAYNNEIQSKNHQIGQNEANLNSLLREYDISLQETIADEEALLDKPEIKNQIKSLWQSNENLRTHIDEITTSRDQIITQIKSTQDKLKNAYEKAQEEYTTNLSYYNLKVFSLKLLFILPIFVVFLYLYFKYKKKDSPYTIIISSVVYASTILFLQIVLVFLYLILPKKWFSRIFTFLMSVPALRYIVYYGAVLIVILILGGIVFYIQKKLYDPRKVALRHLKDSKCPNCSFNLELSETYCPKCRRQIKAKCQKCGNYRYIDLDFCPVCGNKETE